MSYTDSFAEIQDLRERAHDSFYSGPRWLRMVDQATATRHALALTEGYDLKCWHEVCHDGGDHYNVARRIENFTTTQQDEGEYLDALEGDYNYCADCGALMMYDWTCNGFVALTPHTYTCFLAPQVNEKDVK